MNDKVVDIYLCSTVRHLMLALLKATNNLESESLILVILDQQNLCASNFNLETLPNNVKIRFINRKEVLANSYSRKYGLLLKILATTNVYPTKYIRKSMVFGVLDEVLGVEIDYVLSTLYLFNDRNRLSRLIRLAFDEYHLIEDGLSNYSGIKLNTIENIKRIFSKKQHNYRYLGDDVRCKTIALLNPQEAPSDIKDKVIRINFVNAESVVSYCFPFFAVNEKDSINVDCVIATQPISIGGLTGSDNDLIIYKNMVDWLESKKITFSFKVHPRENAERYKKEFPNVNFIDAKVPLELIVFGSKTKIEILSIYSSAGLGFEDYCNRHTLINESEVGLMSEIFDFLLLNQVEIQKRLSIMELGLNDE